MSYRVEYKQFDSKTGFGWSAKNFDQLNEAVNFYRSVEKADLLLFKKFEGYSFILRK